jgi:hypothetical protein
MAERPPPQPVSFRDVVEGLTRMDIRHVALIAFVIGVLFHICVVYAVLDDGASSAQTPRQAGPSVAPVTPEPTQVLDRTDCAAISGTDYRSAAERAWFQANCTGGLAPAVEPESDASAARTGAVEELLRFGAQLL